MTSAAPNIKTVTLTKYLQASRVIIFIHVGEKCRK